MSSPLVAQLRRVVYMITISVDEFLGKIPDLIADENMDPIEKKRLRVQQLSDAQCCLTRSFGFTRMVKETSTQQIKRTFEATTTK